MGKSNDSMTRSRRGFAFAEALVMVMFVGTLFMPMIGTLSQSAGRTTDLRHKRMADAQAQSVQAQLLASAPYFQPPAIGAIPEVPLDEASTLTTTLTITEMKTLTWYNAPPGLLATPTVYHYRIDVERVSTDPTLDSPASMSFLTGILAGKPVNVNDPPIYISDAVNFKILIVTIDDSSGVPVGTIVDEIPFNKGANCGAMGGQAPSTNYIEHCPGAMVVHPSGKWLFGAGNLFAWIIDVDPASPYYKQEVWHLYPEANADGTNPDELLGVGGTKGAFMDLSPCGKYFQVMTNCSCIRHFTFNPVTDPPSVTLLYKNHDSDTNLWGSALENSGVSYSRTGMLSVTAQNSSQHGASTANTWYGDPRYIFAGARPVAATPSRWQKLAIDAGHLDGAGFTFSHDGKSIFRHPDGCDSGWGGYQLDLTFSRIGARFSSIVNSDQWGRLALSADGRIMCAPRYEGTNPSFQWYYTSPPAGLISLNTVNQTATAKNSGWAAASGCGRYFVIAKPLETSNNDEVQFINIAQLTSGAPPYDVSPPPVPKLSLGNRIPSGVASRWVERLIVGASDGTQHKAFVLDMGAQKLYKEIQLGSAPQLIAADPSGCWAMAGPRGVTPTVNSFNNFTLRIIDGVLATSSVGFTAGALTSINGGDYVIVTASNTVQIREPSSGQVFTTAFLQTDLGPLNLAQGEFMGGAMRPILTATPTVSAGLAGLYFGDALHSSATVARANDTTVNFSWPGASPPGIAAPFSVRWTGVLKPSTTDTYLLRVNSDDGARVWLDGKLVIDDYYPWHSAQNKDSAPLSLISGVRYSITVEMYNPWSPAAVVLSWKPGAAAWVVIPSTNLETGAPAQPAAFALTAQAGASPYGISYFNGSDTHVFPYVPTAFEFPASPGAQIAVSPDDGVLAVMVPNVGLTASGRRIDLYDINHDVSGARNYLRKFKFTTYDSPPSPSNTYTRTYYRLAGVSGGIETSPLNWPSDDVAIQDGAYHYFGKCYLTTTGNYTFTSESDDWANFGIGAMNPLSYRDPDWTFGTDPSPHGATAYSSGVWALNAGRYNLSIEFIDRNTGAAHFTQQYNRNNLATYSVNDLGGGGPMKTFHGYNPPKFIRSIPMKFGLSVPWGTGSGLASTSMVMRMNPNGESLVVLSRDTGELGEFNLYDNGSWSTSLPAGWSAESDVALSPDGERIYVSLPNANQVVTIENSHYLPTGANRTVIATITLPLKPVSLAQGEGRQRIQHGRWWDPAATGIVGRHGHAQLMHKGKVYFLGGHNSSNSWASVGWYDPMTNSFGSGAAMSGHMYPGAVVFDGKIWIVGGDDQLTTSRGSYANPGGTNVSIYTVETNTVTAGPALDTERNSPAVCTDGDAIYAFGGRGASGFVNTLSMYVAGRWVPVPLAGTAFSNARGSSFMCSYRGYLYIFGGCTNLASYADCKRINLQTLSWDGLSIPSIPGGTSRYSVAGELIGSRVYIFGGESDSSIVMLDLENISSGWKELGNLPFTGYGHQACCMGGRIYVYGGTSVSVPTTCRASNLLQVFTP
ncbi:MAG: PA14 domain-containing protein [Candidatus Zixiibacteriota bacterium]